MSGFGLRSGFRSARFRVRFGRRVGGALVRGNAGLLVAVKSAGEDAADQSSAARPGTRATRSAGDQSVSAAPRRTVGRLGVDNDGTRRINAAITTCILISE